MWWCDGVSRIFRCLLQTWLGHAWGIQDTTPAGLTSSEKASVYWGGSWVEPKPRGGWCILGDETSLVEASSYSSWSDLLAGILDCSCSMTWPATSIEAHWIFQIRATHWTSKKEKRTSSPTAALCLWYSNSYKKVWWVNLQLPHENSQVRNVPRSISYLNPQVRVFSRSPLPLKGPKNLNLFIVSAIWKASWHF